MKVFYVIRCAKFNENELAVLILNTVTRVLVEKRTFLEAEFCIIIMLKVLLVSRFS